MGNPHTAPLGALIALVDDLETRLTATRAGYLDNLTNLDKAISALNDMAVSELTGLTMRFYSLPDVFAVNEVAATLALNPVSIPSLTMPSIKHAYAGFMYFFQNAAGVDTAINGDQYIQVDKAAAGWLSAIKLHNFSFLLADTDTIAGVAMGDVDVKDKVAFGSDTTFQWLLRSVTNEPLNVTSVNFIEIIV